MAEVYTAENYAEDVLDICNNEPNFLMFLHIIGLLVSVSCFPLAIFFLENSIILAAFFIGLGIGSCGLFIPKIVHYAKERNAKYNYIYNNGRLEIVKVRKNGDKETLFSENCESLISMGKYNDHDHMAATRGMEFEEGNSFLAQDISVKRETFQAVFTVDGKNIDFYFEPSEELIKAVQSQYPTKVHYTFKEK